MTTEPLRQVSVWAAFTGLVLVLLLLLQIVGGLPRSDTLPMLLAAVLGFELFLFVKELMHRKHRRG